MKYCCSNSSIPGGLFYTLLWNPLKHQTTPLIIEVHFNPWKYEFADCTILGDFAYISYLCLFIYLWYCCESQLYMFCVSCAICLLCVCVCRMGVCMCMGVCIYACATMCTAECEQLCAVPEVVNPGKILLLQSLMSCRNNWHNRSNLNQNILCTFMIS